MLYAAAVAGETGVSHAIRLLRDEVDRDMAMLGTNTIAGVSREQLMDARGFDGFGQG
jgi:L-lactate dehydrogenase (cytochrome)